MGLDEKNDSLPKVLWVSPFLSRKGEEAFNLSFKRNMKKVAILARNYTDEGSRRLLTEAGFQILPQPAAELGVGAGGEQLLPFVQDADAVIAGLESYSADLLERCPNLKLISRRGIGYDSVDVAACRRLGIAVARTVGQVEGAVAEHLMALLLHFARSIQRENEQMHRGIWDRKMSLGAKNRTLGLVGFGGIGKELARRARAFDMRILYTCRHPDPKWADAYGVQYAPLDELLRESDFVSVCVPLTAETEGMFNQDRFRQMKPGSYFLNAARSPIMDVMALKAAVESGHLGGAAVDVFPYEPCTDSPLVGVKNIVLTPHTAPFTTENFLQMNRAAAQNVIDHFSGTLPPRCYITG